MHEKKRISEKNVLSEILSGIVKIDLPSLLSVLI